MAFLIMLKFRCFIMWGYRLSAMGDMPLRAAVMTVSALVYRPVAASETNCLRSRPFRLELIEAAMRENRNWEESRISPHTSRTPTRRNRTPTFTNRCQYTKARAPMLPMAVHRGTK